MSCRELIEFLSEYLDGQLPVHQRVVFAAHLAICKDCRVYLESFKTTVGLAQQVGKEEVPAKMPEELIRAIQAARKSQAS